MKLNILTKQQLYLLFTLLTIIMLNMNYLQAQTISVCDNGGFEQDFLYYTGFVGKFSTGSNNCTPLDTGGNPVTLLSTTLPVSNRLEIVTSGTDALVGISRTKFGSKALRINSLIGHETGDTCDGDQGLDKIVKEFTVTENNRNFTVWYAVVLENPVGGHINRQPFFSIKCDLAPSNDLCFDADFLMCGSTYPDSSCTYEIIDVLDWTCHNINIPKSEIGNIATLEIMVGDCGLDDHFGYAYIDGICEDCTTSALGSVSLDPIVDYDLCQGDPATICGSYTIPSICNENWELKNLIFSGYTIDSLVIDSINHTFCFDFPKSNFTTEDCIDIQVEATFKSDSFELPVVTSNAVEVCESKYIKYSYNLSIGSCLKNGTTDNISDDYYFVYVNLDTTAGKGWTIDRRLYDPYPNEIDEREIANGTGNQNITLGPFRIQEGDWKMTITFNDTCVFEEDIIPPPFCSGCDNFYGVEISDIKCISGTNGNPDTWTFDLYVSFSGGTNFTLIGPGGGLFSFNNHHPISVGSISPNCIKYILQVGASCESNFTVCPPKPCSSACNLEVYEKNILCTKVNNVVYFDVQLEVSGPSNKYLCYSTDGGITINALPTNQKVGTFTQDVEITVILCDDQMCSQSCTTCFKTIYVPVPECNQSMPVGSEEINLDQDKELKAYPNPIYNNQINLESIQANTKFEIFDALGNLIIKDSFKGKHYKLDFRGSSGLYVIKYKNSKGKISLIKLIKL